jgi:hypothetical protein
VVANTAGFPQILDSVNRVLQEADKITDPWDFNNSVNYTFLPKIISLANKYHIKLVFEDMRMVENAENPLWETESQKKYRIAFSRYLLENNAILLNYNFDPEIEYNDFFDYLHLNGWGRKKWTSQLTSDLKDVLNGQIGYRQFTEGNLQESLKITQPTINSTIEAGAQIKIAGESVKKIKWSYMTEGAEDYEKYLGTGAQITVAIPPYDHRKRVVRIFVFDGCKKENVLCTLVTDTGTNLPPSVDAGPDLISYIGRETQLKVIAKDDKLLPENLLYCWEIIRGSGVLKDSNTITPTLIPTISGFIVVCAKVSDGEYERGDNVSINVNDKNQFEILSLLVGETLAPGDTVIIKWKVIDVVDCVISVSYNAGKTYEPVENGSVNTGDSTWGKFPWVVPINAPVTSTAYLKLAN